MADTKAVAKKPVRKTEKKTSGMDRFKADIDSMLVNGETVIEEGVISGGIYWKAIAVLIFAFLVAIFIALQLGVLLAVVAVLMIIHAVLTKEILMFVLTDRRIFTRSGILQVDVVDIRFSKIESIELERMLPGYLLGYANLVVSGTGNRLIVIPYIANGVQIRRSYNRLTLSDEDLKG